MGQKRGGRKTSGAEGRRNKEGLGAGTANVTEGEGMGLLVATGETIENVDGEARGACKGNEERTSAEESTDATEAGTGADGASAGGGSGGGEVSED